MAALIGLLAALWATMALAKGTSSARFLNRIMVELPACAICRVRSDHVLLAFVLIALCGTAVWCSSSDVLSLSIIADADSKVLLTTSQVGSFLASLTALAGLLTVVQSCGTPVTSLGLVTLAARRPDTQTSPRCSRPRALISSSINDDDEAMRAV